jgi:hypothetical protein
VFHQGARQELGRSSVTEPDILGGWDWRRYSSVARGCGGLHTVNTDFVAAILWFIVLSCSDWLYAIIILPT